MSHASVSAACFQRDLHPVRPNSKSPSSDPLATVQQSCFPSELISPTDIVFGGFQNRLRQVLSQTSLSLFLLEPSFAKRSGLQKSSSLISQPSNKAKTVRSMLQTTRRVSTLRRLSSAMQRQHIVLCARCVRLCQPRSQWWTWAILYVHVR